VLKTEKDIGEDRVPKKAYFPFSGGKHLCPGMHFAFAEILGTTAALVLGIDILGIDGKLLEVPILGGVLWQKLLLNGKGRVKRWVQDSR
jgi:cytochrome P450